MYISAIPKPAADTLKFFNTKYLYEEILEEGEYVLEFVLLSLSHCEVGEFDTVASLYKLFKSLPNHISYCVYVQSDLPSHMVNVVNFIKFSNSNTNSRSTGLPLEFVPPDNIPVRVSREFLLLLNILNSGNVKL